MVVMFDLISLIRGAGYLGVLGIVYAETGLLVGVFLPGDSLLFTAGFLASQGALRIGVLCLLTGIGAVLGDNTGYWLGRRFGPAVFSRKDSLLFDQSYLERAEQFYAAYGSSTLILARFVPVVRTIAPTMAGVGRMHYAKFFLFSVIAASLWGVGLPLTGYWLGSRIPGIDQYLIPIVALIILVSVAPGVWHVLKNPVTRGKLFAKLKSVVR
jgi:membrane-associated protein